MSEPQKVKGRMGTYILLNVIGQGGYGVVWKVQKEEDQKEYVMKIQWKLEEKEKQFIDLLISEYEKFNGFTKFYEYFQFAGSFYVVQEYCQGGDLKQLLKKRGNSPKRPLLEKKEIYSIISDVVEALLQLEQVHLYHRDIKPDNILIYIDPITKTIIKSKLCDCGLIKSAKDQNQTKQIGTQAYQALEIAQKKENYTNKVDIWSLGAVIYELYAECELFDGDQSEALEKIKSNNRPKLLKSINDLDIEIFMKELIISMLDEKPEKRPNLKQIYEKVQAFRRVEEELQRLITILTDLRNIQDNTDINELERHETILKNFLKDLEKPFPEATL